ncbi:MAG: aminotransferase class IV, partial [Planctomycetota bacterium]|jgi:branched-subunit amino acid aminotransferase/4-amino-4-deoxychorismate lyase
VPFLLEEHLERLLGSCLDLGIRPAEDRAELNRAVASLIEQTAGEAYLRIAVTRGSGYGPWPRAQPRHGRTVIVARPLAGYPAELYSRGMKLATSSVPRSHASPLVGHKTANYLDSVLARREAAAEGADEALMLNSDGRVAELAAANVFAVLEGEVITPWTEEGALPGVTRALVLELAAAEGIAARERRLETGEFREADEAFATNSLLEICPASELDGARLGRAVPGPITARLQAAYREEVARRCVPSGR